ncbi:MAG: hypothetical protein AAFU61_16235, partial [Pseudomonadota bacterium]
MISKVQATSYGVQYVEGPGAPDAAALANVDHELLILEPLNYGPGYDAVQGAADIDTIQAGGKQVFLYMSIGETSDLRRWWDPAWTDDGTDLGARTAAMPDWISDTFSEASLGQARLVEFFEADGSVNQDWLTALKDEIDFLITDLGADGLFLDNVASYFEWFALPNDDRPASFFASAMSDLVKEISDYALSLNPNVQIIANGDPFLPFNTGDRPGKGQQFLDAISAMLQESVYYANDVRLPDTVNRDALFD